MDIFEAARQGRLDRVQAMLRTNPAAVRARDDARYTALHWAAIRAQWEVFQLLVAIFPEHPYAHVHLGDAHRRCGDLAKAETSFNRAIDIEPRISTALTM